MEAKTGDGKLRVILLTHGGAELMLERLTALDCIKVVAVFVETETQRHYPLREKFRRSLLYDGWARTVIKPARKLARLFSRGADLRGERDEVGHLRETCGRLGVPVHFLSNYHAPESIAMMSAAEPDLGVVGGTNILKESVFGIPRLGCVNLHQGLVPFYRGGPVLFWELFNGEREIGITVHTVAAQVDAGEIVLQQTLPLEYDYEYGLDFESFIKCFREEKMFARSADIMAQAVRMIAEGTARPQPQDVTLGRRYRLPTKKEKDELRRRLRARLRLLSAKHTAAGGESKSP
jgi:folate-dependent phosphoribosylglycinamide formyltransferase PurN